MKRIVIIIVLFTCCSFDIILSQANMINIKGESARESIFEKYVTPNFSEEFKYFLDSIWFSEKNSNCYDCKGYHLSFTVLINTDKYGKVKNIKVSDMEDDYNNTITPAIFVQSLKDSIKSISKEWILRPKLHKITLDMTEREKEIADECNKDWRTRPFEGRKKIFLILEFSFGSTNYYLYDDILLINDVLNEKQLK